MNQKKSIRWCFGLLATTAVGVVCLTVIDLKAVTPGWFRSQSQVPMARKVVRGEPVDAGEFLDSRDLPIKLPPIPSGITVSDIDISLALCASLPHWNPPTVPSMMHALRLWGVESEFTNEMVGLPVTGALMRDALLSDRQCAKRTLGGDSEYLTETPYGVAVTRINSDAARHYRGEAHFGQLLKVLAETGAPLSAAVETRSGKLMSVRDILRHAVLRFPEANELEFIGIALGLYLPPQKAWVDQFGVTHDFDELVVRLIEQPLGEGACGGCHLPYTVAVIVRVDEQQAILSAAIRDKAIAWLTDVSRRLEVAVSSEDGSVTNWAANSPKSPWNDDVLDQIALTGDHLEWIAIAPRGVRPSEQTVNQLILRLSDSLAALPEIRIRSFKTLLPCSHAARALCLLRNIQPHLAWRQLWDEKRIIRSKRMGFELGRL